MKTLLVLAAFALGASAQAARLNTQDFTTAQVRAIVAEHGVIVLSTSSFGYDRFVAKRTFCRGGEKAVAAYVPTLDSDAAFIGYTCVAVSRGDSSGIKTYARSATACREGSTQAFSDGRDGGYDSSANSVRICSDGKWKLLHGADPVGPK